MGSSQIRRAGASEAPSDRPPAEGLPERFRLDGRRALITGGAGGIGRAIAQRLLFAGASVALLDRDPRTLQRVSERFGDRVVPLVGDVLRPAEVRRAVHRAVDALGGLDLLVAAAGIADRGTAEEVDLHRWRKVLDINLTGTYTIYREALPYLRQGRDPAVVAISSVYSLIGGAGRSAYSASKGGVDALVRSLAAEGAPAGVRVNAVNPGYIRTPMTEPYEKDPATMAFFRQVTPLPRLGEPEDVADAVLYLLSPAASFVTGVCLPIDGGRSLGR
jgi:NAD(P)-dependent dehydrogenase (short-subunit alcohol dehydrogenase family)